MNALRKFIVSEDIFTTFWRGGVLVVTSFVLALTLTTIVSQHLQRNLYRVGSVAMREIRAPHDFSIEDTRKTEQLRAEQGSEATPIYQSVKRGEVIVRHGDVVNGEQEQKLRQLYTLQHTANVWRMLFGYLILNVVVLTAIYWFTVTFWPHFAPSIRDLIVIAITLCGSLALVKLIYVVGEALRVTTMTEMPEDAFILLTPFAAGGVLLQVTLGAPAVIMFITAFSVFTGVYLEQSWLLLSLIIVGNVVGALSIRRGSRRAAFINTGMRIALINALLVCCFFLIYPESTLEDAASRMFWAFWGGVASGFFAVILTPIAEVIGGYVTDIKLLELASLDHPLLKELSIQAPGTWNHSMVMGQMSEVAAESIGANALLARVGAYYHDIGKTKKPAYFVENQERENRHDKLTPSMSALIVKAHVKEGVELAREHNLPKAIIDFIPQHHGTSLIEYFYDKALREAEASEDIDQNNYRYGGPKPQTREAAILMLADSVEASSRTVSEPTQAKFQGLVQKIINKVFVSGQLDESTLTLKDLHLIAKSFTRVLSGIHHRRVEYSMPAEKVAEHRSHKGEHGPHEHETSEQTANGEAQATKHETGDATTDRPVGEADGNKRPKENGTTKQTNGAHKDAIKRLGMS